MVVMRCQAPTQMLRWQKSAGRCSLRTHCGWRPQHSGTSRSSSSSQGSHHIHHLLHHHQHHHHHRQQQQQQQQKEGRFFYFFPFIPLVWLLFFSFLLPHPLRRLPASCSTTTTARNSENSSSVLVLFENSPQLEGSEKRNPKKGPFIHARHARPTGPSWKRSMAEYRLRGRRDEHQDEEGSREERK